MENKIIDGYTLVPLENILSINNIISVHYFEYSKNYIFEGEKHDFWEFVYVDKGEVNVMADDKKYLLKKDEMIFHKPNEWHTVLANKKVAPNLIVVSFDSKDEAMHLLEGKIITANEHIKVKLANIVKYAKEVFSSRLDDPMLKKYIKKSAIPIGSEQLMKLNLEMLLLYVIRNNIYSLAKNRGENYKTENFTSDKVAIIKNLLQENINDKLTLDDICEKTLMSKSSLQKLFKKETGESIIFYYNKIKIEKAKTLIRESEYNFSQISNILGFSTIHYFSRIFKNITGMTPSQYSSSTKKYI